MWRCDAGRTACSAEELPETLRLEWERVESPRQQVWDDPLNHDLMPYDRVFEPVVSGGTLILPFNDRDKVMGLDLRTGAERWTFYAGGPVRLPPACAEGKVYVASDDGFLHCLRAGDGVRLWSFRGAPSARKALGNGRLISAWPARGGPVVRDGVVYFAASIWPFMGTFLYALEAETGNLRWVNDGTGSDFIKQPHSAPSFAGVAPQGALVATPDLLLVPGGRSVPAAFDRSTGALRYFHLNDGGKGNGGSFVAAGDRYFYVHTRERGVRVYDLKTGIAGRSTMNEPVIDGVRLFDSGPEAVRELGTGGKVLWEVKADGSGDLIKAGRRLYAAGKESLSAIDLDGTPRVAWKLPVRGEARRLLAAAGKLVAVTLDGRIQVYGGGESRGSRNVAPQPPDAPSASALQMARHLLQRVEDPGGHALIFGPDAIGLADALLAASAMQVTVVEPDPAAVEAQRRRYDAQGRLGSRIAIHAAQAGAFQAPPYVAGIAVIARAEQLPAAYASVRPYGGILVCPGTEALDLRGLEQARLERQGDCQLVIREGALPGASGWTHQYGDIGNTVNSADLLVRAPLGVLWFGGNSNQDVLPRHGHGPPEQVAGGRLFLEGMNNLSARDVYTGRVLWKHGFGDLGTFGIYYNETYADTPLSTAYNQKHIPGANGRGTNFVATEDEVYVAVKGACQVLDSRRGTLKKTIPLRPDPADPAQWAFIGVLEGRLLAGDDFAHFSLRTGSRDQRAGAPIEDYSASAGLAVFDRREGRLLWRMQARHSFLHNGIVAGNGRIYCLDKLTQHAEGLLKRRGLALPRDYRILALDAATGQVLWERDTDIFGTWLGYSAGHDLLLQAGAKATDRLSSETGAGMAAYGGRDGKVRWMDLQREYTGPCILQRDRIITGANSYKSSAGAFDLRTGKPLLVENPLTGKKEPWRLNRTYGCNTVIASEHLLTFRSGAAGFFDLESLSGTANLGGFKSGCTSNLVAACGVLNAPDYTRTCSCAYQNQTSLALVHMPGVEMWTFSQFGLDGKAGDRVLRAGINFGAPGNRRAPDGTLWLEYPLAGTGNAPGMGIEVRGSGVRYFRRHSSAVDPAGAGHAWVAASGLVGECELTITPALRLPVLTKPKSLQDEDEGKASADKPAAAEPPPEAPPPPRAMPKAVFPPQLHTVRLHFREPEGSGPGERVFSVSLQGKPVLQAFDVAREGGVAVREFSGVMIGPELRVALTAAPGAKAPPVLCGLEFRAE